MNDYELLYYIYQQDEEALEMLMERYRRSVYFISKAILDRTDYKLERSDEMDDIIQLGYLELYQSIYAYRDDLNCSFAIYSQKCIEMGVRKYIRGKRGRQNYEDARALRLDEKVMDEGAVYRIDRMSNTRHEFEGHKILNWYHEETLLKYLQDVLKESEFQIIKLKIEGYTQKEIALLLCVNTKRVHYVMKKTRKVLLSYID